MKNLLRFICFLLLLSLTLCAVNGLFGIKVDANTRRYNTYKALPKDTVDVVFIGSSSTYRYWVPALAFEEYGFTGYPLSMSGQLFVMYETMIKEALKYQNPDVFVIDIRSVGKKPENASEQNIRATMDILPASLDRLQIVKKVLDYHGNEERSRDLSFYIRFLLYHNRWIEGLNEEDWKVTYNAHMGFLANKSIKDPGAYSEDTFKLAELDEKTADAFNDLLDFCDTLSQDIVFVAAPHKFKEKTMERINAAFAMAADRGYDCINFNTEAMRNAVGLDRKTDFYDRNHTNLSGAIKYTRYLGEYLRLRYELPDHRGDGLYNNWEEAYQDLVNYAEKNWNDEWIPDLLTNTPY